MRDIERAERQVAEVAGHPRGAQTVLNLVEVLEGLQNVDPISRLPAADGKVRLQFSDWMVVEAYLAELASTNGRIDGHLHEAAILATARCLWHQHSRCHELAVRTLGHVDHPFARGVLLHALTFATNDGLEREILDALRRQARRLLQQAPEQPSQFGLALLRRSRAVSGLSAGNGPASSPNCWPNVEHLAMPWVRTNMWS